MNAQVPPSQQRPPRWDVIVFFFILLLFATKLCFLAASVNTAIPPDEQDRIETIRLYSRHPGLVLPDTPSYHLGVLSRRPFLYFWVMGRLLHLNVFFPDFLFLRLVNIFLALGTVIFARRFFDQLCDDKAVALFACFVLTHIPMFSFLNAFVSYDNLVNLLAAACFFFLFRYIRDARPGDIFNVVALSLLGCLTKQSFLPLFLIFALIILMEGIRRDGLPRFGRKYFETINARKIARALVLCFLLLLNVRLYGVNLLRYGKLIPACTQVLTYEQCRQKENFRVYQELNRRTEKIPREEFLPPHLYFFGWAEGMQNGILGIFGHKLLFKSRAELFPYNIFFLIAFGLFLRNFRRWDKALLLSAAAAFVYIAALFLFVNYRSYLKTAYIMAGLQGRYLFPVLFPLVFMFSRSLLYPKNALWRGCVILLAGGIFFWGDLPYFLLNVPEYWYLPNATVQLATPGTIL